jgi:hypothetical protein
MGEVLGGDKSCKGVDQWKEFAAQACQNRGLALSDFAPGLPCDGGFADVKYACCKAGPQPVKRNDGQVDGAPACFGDAQGGPAACKPAEDWTKLASALCGEKGSSLSQVAFAEPCDKGSFRFTKYVCCDATKPPPPPPPPQACINEKLVDAPDACADPGILKERAFDFCSARKLVLTDLGGDLACNANQPGAVTVTCCAPQPQPPQQPPPDQQPPKDPRDGNPDPNVKPPQPGAQCFASAVKQEGCADDGTLKERAAQECAAAGAVLSMLEVSNDCAGAGSTMAAFQCCAQRP